MLIMRIEFWDTYDTIKMNPIRDRQGPPQPPNTTPRTPAHNVQQQIEHVLVFKNTTMCY